ncbi:MAG: glycosyltransferase, partial [Candidatus Paceibacterales bacterium]
ILVIPIGANFDTAPSNPRFFKKIMDSQKLDPKGRTLMFFGYAFPSKRLEVLLDALNEPQLHDYQVLLIGAFGDETDYQRMLKNKISSLNQNGPRVGTTGFLEGHDVSVILQEGKYFVLPNSRPLSAKSGTAIAAIQNGLIVISRGAKRPEDTFPFENLKNSFLLDEATPQSIAEAIALLENSPTEVKTILRGAEELKKYFSWPNIVKQHLKLYEEL